MPIAARGGRKALGQILKESGLVTEEQIQEALDAQKEQGGALGTILVDLGYVTEDDIDEVMETLRITLPRAGFVRAG